MRIAPADLDDPQVAALIALHHREAHGNSPAGSAFALDLGALRDPAITLWAAWRDDRLLGIGALKRLDAGHGEIKSMRTAPGEQRGGVAHALLDHIVAEARRRGYSRLSLETGTNAAFAPARALYEGAGFLPSGALGDYALTDFNRCYSLAL